MENYYEYLEMDMTASPDDITTAAEKATLKEGVDLQKIREIKSILLNENARRVYDEKLVTYILNKGKQRNEFNSTALREYLNIDNAILHDKYIWMAIALFVVDIISDFIFGLNISMAISVVVMMLTLGLFFMDWKLLQAHGKAAFSKGWILFSPIYVLKRCNAVGTGRKLLVIWLAIFVLSLAVKTVFNSGTALLENSACTVVTDIYHSQLNQYSTSCKSVTITESKGRIHYGFAELSNGLTQEITVNERQDGNIYVTLE